MSVIKKPTQFIRRRFHNRPEKHKVNTTLYEKAGLSIKGRYAIQPDGTIHTLYNTHRDGVRVQMKEQYSEPVGWNKMPDGRLYISINSERWYAHQLAWYLTYGVKPSRLKFKDGDKSNYQISNLYPQAVGVQKPHQARVRVGSEVKCLGSYLTKQEAVDAQNAFKALRDMGIV